MNFYLKYLIFFVISCFFIFHVSTTHACGTIDGWVNTYFDKANSQHDDALYMVHCKPVLTGSYKATPGQHEALANMIKKGLTAFEYCDRNLATKNFFIFDQLFWLQGTDIHNEIVTVIENKLKRPLHEIKGTMSLYNRESRTDYCSYVNYEIKGMQWNGEAVCNKKICKEINLTPLKEKSILVSSFINETHKCLKEKDKASGIDKIVKVKSKTLNMRSKPSTKSSIVRQHNNGEYLLVNTIKNDWLQVMDKNCSTGWVAEHLTFDARSK